MAPLFAIRYSLLLQNGRHGQSSGPPLQRPPQSLLQRRNARARRRHTLQGRREEQRGGILRQRRLGSGGARDRQGPQRKSHDHQADRRGRALFSHRQIEHFQEKACPALDAGWYPVFRPKMRQCLVLASFQARSFTLAGPPLRALASAERPSSILTKVTESIGLANRKPCAEWQPRSIRVRKSSTFSTPLAQTVTPKPCASSTAAAQTDCLALSVAQPVT